MNGAAVSAVPGSVVTPIFANPNVKDSRWLTLEVCREYTRNKCTRSDQECKFAHPPAHVEVQNGRVTCCFDSIKGKCQRKDPPCKYLHPPQHLKEQLLQNGRNNLILRNLQWQALAGGLQPFVPTAVPTVMYEPTNANGKPAVAAAATPTAGFHNTILQTQYPTVLSGPPGTYMVQNNPSAYNPFINTTGLTGMVPGMDNTGVSIPVSASNAATQQVHTGLVTGPTPSSLTQKVARADRLESSTAVSGSSGNISSTWNGHPAHGSPSESAVSSASPYNQHHPVYFQPSPVVEVLTNTSKKRTRDPADDLVLSMNPVPGMVPIVKRTAVDGKSGVPMYPSTGATATYQQALAAMQLQQQYVPVTIAGHPPGMPRF